VTCRSCGFVAKCPHCDVSLTRHANGKLICHYCGYEISEYKECPECRSRHIGGISVGTQQVEEALQKEFAGIRTLRMDFDSTRGKEGHGRILREFGRGDADVLVGTQMIVKGHDFPNVTLVGVLMADLSLNESDYRSQERTYQLITQAVGRAGRGTKPGTAVIQTYQPENTTLRYAAAQTYGPFYREEIAYRKIMRYPPIGGLLAILGSAASEELLTVGMGYIRKYIDIIDKRGVLAAIGPAPQTVGKVRDRFRQVIYLRHKDTENLIRARHMIEEYVRINSGFEEIRIEYDINV
jgi:primosomal protein N' (replication factor Y)